MSGEYKGKPSVKGVSSTDVEPYQKEYGELCDLVEVKGQSMKHLKKDGYYTWVAIVVTAPQKTPGYKGCPECFKKMQGFPGKHIFCNECGMNQEVTMLQSYEFMIAGDKEFMLKIPPEVKMPKINIGDQILFRGGPLNKETMTLKAWDIIVTHRTNLELPDEVINITLTTPEDEVTQQAIKEAFQQRVLREIKDGLAKPEHLKISLECSPEELDDALYWLQVGGKIHGSNEEGFKAFEDEKPQQEKYQTLEHIIPKTKESIIVTYNSLDTCMTCNQEKMVCGETVSCYDCDKAEQEAPKLLTPPDNVIKAAVEHYQGIFSMYEDDDGIPLEDFKDIIKNQNGGKVYDIAPIVNHLVEQEIATVEGNKIVSVTTEKEDSE
jgi:hypothetical protein